VIRKLAQEIAYELCFRVEEVGSGLFPEHAEISIICPSLQVRSGSFWPVFGSGISLKMHGGRRRQRQWTKPAKLMPEPS
jgi:hypothetical protein